MSDETSDPNETPMDTLPAEPAHAGDTMAESERRHPLARVIVWVGISAAFVAFVALAKVSTHLGVEAVPWDKRGREYVWRVWWRSRHQIVGLGPSWGSALALGTLAVAFVLLGVAAVWVALCADECPSKSPGASQPDLVYRR